MKIVNIEVQRKNFKLKKPYRIYEKTIDSVENFIVKLTLENGVFGLGSAAIASTVTCETPVESEKALNIDNLKALLNQSIYQLPAHCRYLEQHLKTTPAARTAVDIALHDAYGKLCQLPLVEIFGRVHTALPTSITIGIKGIEDSIKEGKEYEAAGFRIFKIKLGENVDKDIELLHRLREVFANRVKLRVDINRGFPLSDLIKFMKEIEHLEIELIEQPLDIKHFHELECLPDQAKSKIAADESLQTVEDAFKLIHPQRLCGIFNIKLVKCGGIYGAQKIADLAKLANIELMWGCMDESIISIAAALHVAFASPNTRYLDLDGSLDLAEDVVTGGFILENGMMRLTDKPGLGVE